MRWLLLLVSPLAVGACVFDSVLPLDPLLECRAPDDCPAPFICLVSEERCIQPGSACVSIQDGIAVAERDGNTCGPNSICLRGACQTQRCGDGIKSGDETCDGTDGCRENCTRCGDGVTDPGEDCDDGPANGTLTSGACPATCVADCGNGFVDFGEICDDGNENPADGCDACRLTAWRLSALIGGSVNALTLELGGIFRFAVDPSGNVYIAHNNRVRRVDTTGNVTTVAGTGKSGFSGDGDSALSAELSEIQGVAVDGLGNVYIADEGNHRVRRVDERGVITTFAGTGVFGYSGDGAEANSAELSSQRGVSIDRSGNVYIVHSDSIRRVDTSGTITSVAGAARVQLEICRTVGADPVCDPETGVCTGVVGTVHCSTETFCNETLCLRGESLCDGTLTLCEGLFDEEQGIINYYTCSDGTGGLATDTSCVTTEFGGLDDDDIPATTAALHLPGGVAADGVGNLYVAETGVHRVRRIGTNGIITTAAGTGNPGFSGDGGAAIDAELNAPLGVAVDSLGNVYVADSANNRIRRIDPDGIITTFAGTGNPGFSGDGGAATSAELNTPVEVAVDSLGNVYVNDSLNQRVRRIGSDGVITTVAGSGAGSSSDEAEAATVATLGDPSDVAFDPLGNMYIADTLDGSVWRVDTAGLITVFAGTGAGDDSGISSGDGGAATSAQLGAPTGVALDGLGNVYIADRLHHRIRRVSADGIITTIAGTDSEGEDGGFSGDGDVATSAELAEPRAVAVDTLGNVYIADSLNNRIRRIDSNDVITTFAGTGSEGSSGDDGEATSAELGYPTDVAVDTLGNVYIAQGFDHRIRRVSTNGIITTVAGTGTGGFSGDSGAATSAELSEPWGLAVDGLGNVYIADRSNHRIRRVDINGVITTVVGTGTIGSSGDGGQAVSATLNLPMGVAVDGLGNVYFADSGSRRIRRADTAGIVTSVVGGPIDPEGSGPIAVARLADPHAIVVAADFTLVAGGTSGTVERATASGVDVLIGRYPQEAATGSLARFRDQNFGTVSGVAYDADAGVIYLTESSANCLHAVSLVEPEDANTWTIAALNDCGGSPTTGGFADGALAAAKFREPTGLYLEGRTLFVADTGNHAIRKIDLSTNVSSTVVGVAETRGFFGDSGEAIEALLFEPQAITRCPNGDLFVADTGNHRIRRVADTGVITTVLGDGTPASSGEGSPASIFPVHDPLALACDGIGNLFVTSTTTVRLLPSNEEGVIDGTGSVKTIYASSCLTALALVDETKVQVADCSGSLVQLQLGPL